MGWRSISPIIVAAALGLGACSILHRHDDPPQQQFLTALKHGDSVQANRIWLSMNAEDRANLSHSIGIKPQLSADEVKAQLVRHAREKAAEEGDGEEMADPDPAEVETGDINSQIIEMPGLDADPAGALQNLPNLNSTEQPPPGEVPTIEQIQ